MARFVLVFRLTPAEYYSLTVIEREALLKAHNERHKSR